MKGARQLPPSLRRLYPFQGYSAIIRGHLMHYLDQGSGVPIVMVHGNPTWSFFFRRLVLGLSAQYRCIVPDHIGCGLSDKPQTDHYPYTLERRIEDLNTLLHDLDLESFHLIVHDWGGAIGIGAALQDASRVRSLTILNTAAFHSSNIPKRIRLCRIPWLGEAWVRGLNGFAGAATIMAMRPGARLQGRVREAYLFPYDNWKNRVALAEFVKDIPLEPRDRSYQTLSGIERELGQMASKPTQIIWGMRDFCFDETFLETWLERFPHAKVKRLPDAGHYLLEDEPETILSTIRRFLQGQAATPQALTQ